MAIDYAKLRAKADRLLAENGQPVTLKRMTYVDNGNGGFDESFVEVGGNGVIVGIKERDHALFAEIQAGDAMLVCVLDAKPEIDDAVTANGQQWSVVSVVDVNPANHQLLYKLQVRHAA